MTLREVRKIAIPDSNATSFDHGAFEPSTRRVFVAHTARSRLDVIDHDGLRHIASVDGFPGAAGVVADDGTVLVTNRGSAQLAVVDAATFKIRAIYPTSPRPNGVAFHAGRQLAVAACIGDDTQGPELLTFSLNDIGRWSLSLPGQPRWCVMDAAGDRIFVAIREPAMVLVARLPELRDVRHWTIPVEGPHGLDIDHASGMLYVACDGGALVQCDARDGRLGSLWPLPGGPDATFFNAVSGLVHVAIGDPGVIQSINPRTAENVSFHTAPGAGTTALAPPDQLYVFSPAHGGVLALAETGAPAEPGTSVSR
jgi:DNA-binding beta-propeller fold protein YncE